MGNLKEPDDVAGATDIDSDADACPEFREGGAARASNIQDN